jgi:hypothetical protein
MISIPDFNCPGNRGHGRPAMRSSSCALTITNQRVARKGEFADAAERRGPVPIASTFRGGRPQLGQAV